jgi:hypothetical protein
MKGSVIACLLMPSGGGLPVAQEVPRGDVFLGNSFVRYYSALSIPTYTATGGLGGFSWNLTSRVAGEADLGGYQSDNVGNLQFNTTTFNYLFGPRISYGRSTKVGPFFHTIVVKKKAAIVAKRLPDVLFPPNSAPVNNFGKRLLLEELKTDTSADPTGAVYFIGHQSSTETASDIPMKRALNAAAVISAGTGVCAAFPAAQVQVKSLGTEQTANFQPHFCGASAEAWFVPANGQPPTDASESKAAVAAGVAALGCPH